MHARTDAATLNTPHRSAGATPRQHLHTHPAPGSGAAPGAGPEDAKAFEARVVAEATALVAPDTDGGDAHDDGLEEVSPVRRTATILVVVLPFVGLIAAMALSWGEWFTWTHVVMLAVGYVLTGLGITVGFHRLFTHKSFEAGPVVTAVLGVLGSMAVQGSLIDWVQDHRRHHQHSDKPDDPHSPHVHGEGLKAWVKGVWHSHIGWFFTRRPKGMERYAPDLWKNPLIRFVDRMFVLWVALGLLIPAAIGYAATGTWGGALLGLLWGGLARVFLIHHVTWSVNSVCHLWGTRPFRSHDHSRNNPIFGVLALGEGWHNNHHAFPASARHGLRWWEFDISYITIRAMEVVGLARNVRVPERARLEAKKVNAKAA